jgi:hypothetical protein
MSEVKEIESADSFPVFCCYKCSSTVISQQYVINYSNYRTQKIGLFHTDSELLKTAVWLGDTVRTSL